MDQADRSAIGKRMTVEEAASRTLDEATNRPVSPRTVLSWLKGGLLPDLRTEKLPRRRHIVYEGTYRDFLRGKPYRFVDEPLDPSSPWHARLVALEERVEQLQRQVADLMQHRQQQTGFHRPVTDAMGTVASRQVESWSSDLATGGEAGYEEREERREVLPLPPRLPRTRRATRPLAGQELPEGWIPVSTWCGSYSHNVNFRSARRSWCEEGEPPYMPRPETRPKAAAWISYGGSGGKHAYPVTEAYTPEQHVQACKVAAIRWPHRFRPSCGPSCPYHHDEFEGDMEEVDGDTTRDGQ